MPRLRTPRYRRGRCCGVGGTLKDLRARLLQVVLDRERQLLDVGDATPARELRGQLQVLRDEALILAIKEETNLAQRFHVVFVAELYHSGTHWIIAIDPMQAKSASVAAA